MNDRAAPVQPDTVTPPPALWRIARAQFPPLDFERSGPDDTPTSHVGSRFAILGGGILYACATPIETLQESLLPFVRSNVFKDISDEVFSPAITSKWIHSRRLIRFSLNNPLPFLDLQSNKTLMALEWLTRPLLPTFDEPLLAGTLPNVDPNVTRAISSWAYTASSENGTSLYSGLRFTSASGNTLWVAFDGTEIEVDQIIDLDKKTDLVSKAAQAVGLRVIASGPSHG